MKLTKFKLKQIIEEELTRDWPASGQEKLKSEIKNNIAELVDNFKRYAEEHGTHTSGSPTNDLMGLWSYIDERVKQINPR